VRVAAIVSGRRRRSTNGYTARRPEVTAGKTGG